jgi:hypothetical protein
MLFSTCFYLAIFVCAIFFWTACAMSISPFSCCQRGRRTDKFLYVFQALFQGELKASAMGQKLQALTTSKRGSL